MPSDTFFRLPEEKRRRIFEAAVDEFAAHRFEVASINHVVKAAAIPRGSFYQYFTGKEDLYTYVLQEISKEKINIVFAVAGSAGDDLDLFGLVKAALPHIMAWADENPRYWRIGMLMMEDNPYFVQGVLSGMIDSLSFLRGLLQREEKAGRLRPGVNPETVLRLILAVSIMIMRNYYEAADGEDMRQKLLSIYDIICYGAIRQEGV